MPEIKFTRRGYYHAAQEHLGMANRLLRQKEYFAAHSFAGIAVEAILRAHGVRDGETFFSSHNIDFWAQKSNLAPLGPEEKQNDFRIMLDEVNIRWRANQRYMTIKMLDTYLYSAGLDNIRGDRIKYSANRLFELADFIVTRGVERWK